MTLLISNSVGDRVPSIGGIIVTGEDRRIRRKPRHSATLSTINPTWTTLALGPGFRGDRPASNSLSQAKAKNYSNFFVFFLLCIVIDSLWIKPTVSLNSNFIGIITLHVSGSLSAYHQEFLAVHRLWYILCSCDEPFATRSTMELEFHPAPGSKRSSQLHKMYQCRCTAKNSWWWEERLPETCSLNTNKIWIQCIC
jgi:hypothetical protein